MSKRAVSLLICVFLPMLLMLGCGEEAVKNANNAPKVKIVASLFPQYDFARQIAGERADISLLLPPGTESHSFDVKPRDMKDIYDSDMFIYTGEYMEPWANTVIAGVDEGKPYVVDASLGIELIRDDDGEHDFDPHIWLNPLFAIKMTDNITTALCEIDPEYADTYRSNHDVYVKKLEHLDKDFETMINRSKRCTLVFGGRFAYIYFLNRYKLDYQTAYEGCSTENEPGASTIKGIIGYINENKIPCIYNEELVDPKLARSIAEQTGIKCETFSTAHNLTKDELSSGISFIDIMEKNLLAVERGLND